MLRRNSGESHYIKKGRQTYEIRVNAKPLLLTVAEVARLSDSTTF